MPDQYDYVADKYDSFMEATPFRPYVEAFTFFNVVGDVTDLNILDLATGTGSYARAVTKRGAKSVTGIDLSKEMVALAQHAEIDDPLGIHYEVGDATQFKMEQPVDLAIAVYLLHYSPTEEYLQSMCSNIASNLSSGGRFVTYLVNPKISTQQDYYEKYGLFVRTKPTHETNGEKVVVQLDLGGEFTPEITFYRWNKETIEKALEKAGFKSIRWVDPLLSPRWDGTEGDLDHFDDYLAVPHALVLECEKA
ncbi:MAG: class I SAM-dependent methyltransferase [Chloroflexota bacterium]